VKFGVAVALAVLTGLLAQVSLYTPFTPVPFTGQVVGVALMGSILGSRWGATSGGIYFLMGFLGLPVFAGAWEAGQGFDALRGVDIFTGAIGAKALSVGYLVGFPVQAYLVGLVAERHRRNANVPLVSLATLAGVGLLAFVALDVYFIAEAGDYSFAPLTSSDVPLDNFWLGILLGALVVLTGGAAWLALTTRARRERIELFMGNIVGLVALYAVGAIGFILMWNHLGFGDLGTMNTLRYTVLPFIGFDMLKILGVTGLVTLVRPKQAELEARHGTDPATEADRTDVR
jgi:biotin transporter BioY